MSTIHVIEIDPNTVREITNGWQLKVNVLDLGMYINGFRALRSKKEPGTWWVQPPARKVGNRYKDVVEFNKSETLWLEIHAVILAFLGEVERNQRSDITQAGEANEQRDMLNTVDQLFPGNKKYGGGSNEHN
jgi:hypothetical protein